MSFLAVDPGTRRHGIAVADGLGMVARPLEAVPAENLKDALERINELVIEWAVTDIVVGLPLHMDGQESPSSKKARVFAEKLQALTGRTVHVWDERLTTDEARQQLIQEGKTRKKLKEAVDARSAQIILRSFLDSRPADSHPADSQSADSQSADSQSADTDVG